MATHTKDALIVTEEYTDTHGNKKPRFKKIGVVVENEEGKETLLLEAFINLAALPVTAYYKDNVRIILARKRDGDQS